MSIIFLLLAFVFLMPFRMAGADRVVNDAAITDDSNTSEWLAYGRTHSEQRFSPLTQINDNNVGELKVDWHLDLPLDSQLVSTPLVVDGVLYFVGQVNVVRAVDAVTGKLLWEYDPESGKTIGLKRKIGWFHNRGLSFYEGKVFAATWDGRLVAIDAKYGKLVWSTRTFGLDEPLYITGAPKAFKGKVVIGNGGADNGPTRGFVAAYDADTGEEAWKFFVVPGNPADGFENEAMEMAAKTWTGEWWKHGGGGNVWHGFTYDAELETLYIGTGNGSPWNQKIRSPGGGDNLFLSSIVALDPDTGDYKWHYQTTPGETWDFNSNMDIMLADLTIEGKAIKALLHAPKNGFFYVIDRTTGKLISAEPFSEMNWASHVDMKTGRPVEIPEARYPDNTAKVMPTPAGAHSWHAMSFNPITGLVYLPTIHLGITYSDKGIDLKGWNSVPFYSGPGVRTFDYTFSTGKNYPASLQAWDPVKQESVWSIPQYHTASPGTLTTAGNLVFQGRPDGHFLAYNAKSGKILWDVDLGLGISAPPITYRINGRQYIALLVGWGGSSSGDAGGASLGWSYGIHTRQLITFSLEGAGKIPRQPPPYYPTPIDLPDFEPEMSLIDRGRRLFGICQVCHGNGYAVAGGMAPDLRASPIPLNDQLFEDVVRQGSKIARGMPAYAEFTDHDLKSIQHFLRWTAREAVKRAR
ncbi:MAG: PQQ-dependent dehydrogenase, methanol/ethanol family [Verrucomicrobia bacterium]|nr:PQQ-dependent dehydrogenase, methanol/ethanol family [Verrucomicrobiota bacterium]MDA1068755.1 PQQ-dependent dehydrogenase, methanol/ethanol family [Verrucomicrobiota bacterium]